MPWNDQLMDELGTALRAYEADEGIGCIVITGSEQGLCGRRRHPGHGAAQLHERLQERPHQQELGRCCEIRKPVIAAVAGFTRRWL